ncbi:MAG: hypothetical protein HYZ75_11275 [Elusimicrobia bacterium]|nr:hypothetical protein [Elusimicrobiota bacterium]
MRKHGRSGIMSRPARTVTLKVETRSRTLLSFGHGRRNCRWTTEVPRNAIKH